MTADASRFQAIRLEALACDPDAFAEVLAEAAMLPDATWTERILWWREHGRTLLLAEDEGAIVGLCGVRPDDAPGAARLWGLFVALRCRTRGIGAALIDSAERWAREQGRAVLNATVTAANAGALAFYRRQGYAVVGDAGRLRPGSAVAMLAVRKNLRPAGQGR